MVFKFTVIRHLPCVNSELKIPESGKEPYTTPTTDVIFFQHN